MWSAVQNQYTTRVRNKTILSYSNESKGLCVHRMHHNTIAEAEDGFSGRRASPAHALLQQN